jgi:hypothetical protein
MKIIFIRIQTIEMAPRPEGIVRPQGTNDKNKLLMPNSAETLTV